MRPEDYPALYCECGSCSEYSQKNHFRLLQLRIGLLIAVAVLGAVAWKSFPQFGTYPPIAIAVTLGILLIFTVIMENKKFEKNWVVSRAVAEVIKRETWLFMMRAKPYEQQDQNQAKSIFKKFLKQISESEALPWAELTHSHEGNLVTQTMDNCRNADFSTRKETYIKDRISDQRNWYARKARLNNVREAQLSLLMWILLGLAVVLAVLNVVYSDLLINAVGIATTASASALSWIGAKSYRELAQSYSIVAHELAFLEEDAKDATSEDQFANTVVEAEGVMSQEHNLWKIKRLDTLKL